MLKTLWKKIKPGFVITDLEEYYPTLSEIRKKENSLKEYSENQLQQFSAQLKKAAQSNNDPEHLLVDAFALVCETASRKLNMRPFDVQILGAIAMNQGHVVEMETGEGKTLVATMPAFLNALFGNGVNVLTFNDYLAKRDAQWMGEIYQFLGMKVGFVSSDMTAEQRRQSYKNDIIYVTAKQAGFDYLRSFLIHDQSELILGPTRFAIIDEVDSILIDEARTPLVIAGKDEQPNGIDLNRIATLINQLERGIDFQFDQYELNAFLTDQGIEQVETVLGINNLYDPQNEVLLYRINQALHANCLRHRDIDYIVRNGRIELVDEFTGRIIEDRKWPHGLQAAIEAKENIRIQVEGRILGKTTLQHFISRYTHICGMTGTAVPAAEEFAEMYHMAVVVIPPNKPEIRIDNSDLIFPNKATKYQALINEIRNVHDTGRPILVGTASVEESETIAELLEAESIKCQVLNAKNDEIEARIVAKAGLWKAITISTNMAGRGTDIKLGGEDGMEREKIMDLGGLYVIGTNKFESRRVDNQLRGRSGRQGDPGESRFFVSLEDELLLRHGINELIPKRFRTRKSISSINSHIINREVNRTQRIVEGKNLDIRKTLFKYASIIEIQRQILHQRRQMVLAGTAESLLKNKIPEFYEELMHKFGNEVVNRTERQVTLAVIDKNWMDYLEEIEMVRQGIHLFAKAGLNPYYEFQRIASEGFEAIQLRIDEDIVRVIRSAHITNDGVDLSKEGLKGPSSTWTYLVSDNPFGDRLEIMLGGNVGFAALAALVNWPLLALYFLLKRILRKKDKV